MNPRDDNREPGEEPDWPAIVDGVSQGQEEACAKLYDALGGLRGFLKRQVGPEDADDVFHEVVLDLVAQIRQGALRAPGATPRYANVIARRKVIAHFRIRGVNRVVERDLTSLVSGNPTPERIAVGNQHLDIAQQILGELSPRDREVLIRFYLQEQTPERIQSEMLLTTTQFRLIKSRAKAKFASFWKGRVSARRTAAGGNGHK